MPRKNSKKVKKTESGESYPRYVKIGRSPGGNYSIELPTEENGSMLLTTIQAQFPNATGLKIKSDSGAWTALCVNEGVLDAPSEGWGDYEYIITVAKKAEKRKLVEDDEEKAKEDLLSDMVVLGIPYSATEDDLRAYFEKFGPLDHCELKVDAQTKKSKGFGFIRYSSVDVVEKVLAASHSMGGRTMEVSFPYKPWHPIYPTKLFIGRLPRETTVDDLKDCFSDYAPLKDVYIPSNFRGFGFVTFSNPEEAEEVKNSTFIIKETVLNISNPAPKVGQR